jgi:hypothetical protein
LSACTLGSFWAIAEKEIMNVKKDSVKYSFIADTVDLTSYKVDKIYDNLYRENTH